MLVEANANREGTRWRGCVELNSIICAKQGSYYDAEIDRTGIPMHILLSRLRLGT